MAAAIFKKESDSPATSKPRPPTVTGGAVAPPTAKFVRISPKNIQDIIILTGTNKGLKVSSGG